MHRPAPTRVLVLPLLAAAACGPAVPADGRPYGQVVPPASAVPIPGQGGALGDSRYRGAPPPPPPADVLVVYLDGWGSRLRAADDGEDDARAGTSWLVASTERAYVDVPPFEGTATEWAQMQACMAEGVSGLPVVFTVRPPERGLFLRLVIGGGAALLGRDKLLGIATRIPDAVARMASASSSRARPPARPGPSICAGPGCTSSATCSGSATATSATT